MHKICICLLGLLSLMLSACNDSSDMSLSPVSNVTTTPTVPAPQTPTVISGVSSPTVSNVLKSDVDNPILNFILGQRNAPVNEAPIETSMQTWSLLAPGVGGFGVQEPLCNLCYDQMKLYNAIVFRDAPVTSTQDLDTYYKKASFNLQSDVVLSKLPRDMFDHEAYTDVKNRLAKINVTLPDEISGPEKLVARIDWDSSYIPHVVGDNFTDVSLGLGYASGMGHMVEMFVLRLLGQSGALQTFDPYALLNSSIDDLVKQLQRLSLINYTEDELFDTLLYVCDAPDACQDIVEGGIAYVSGINKAFKERLPIFGLLDAVGVPWPKWDFGHSIAVGYVLLEVFANPGSHQAHNLETFFTYRKNYDEEQSLALMRDERLENIPNDERHLTMEKAYQQPSYADQSNEYMRDRYIDPNSIAWVNPDTLRSSPDAAIKGIEAIAKPKLNKMSNWLGVAASHSKSGKPLLVGGPQMAYFRPNIFMEYELRQTDASKFQLAGASVPGLFISAFGGQAHGAAWTPTAPIGGTSDLIVEKLCSLSGSTESVTFPTAYMHNQECISMKLRDSGPPFTVHGPVIAWGFTVDDEPVAISKKSIQVETLGASLIPFLKLGRGDIKSGQDFVEVMDEHFRFAVNYVYVDDKDLAYIQTGYYPVRATGSQWQFPTWGTGEWEWQGVIDLENRPHVVNPEEGFLTNWNNTSAQSFYASTGEFSRNAVLHDSLKEKLPVDIFELAEISQVAAVQDAYATHVLPQIFNFLGDTAGLTARQQELLNVLADYEESGARADKDNNGSYEESGPILLDTFVEKLKAQVNQYLTVPFSASLDIPSLGGSAYLSQSIKQILMVVNRAKQNGNSLAAVNDSLLQCGNGTYVDCRSIIIHALTAADTQLTQQFKTSNVDQWQGDASYLLLIPFPTAERWHWQNRPTYQQVSTHF